MAGSSSPRPDDNDCLRLPATSSPRTRGAEKKESTDLRLSQPCPPYATPSSISSFGHYLSNAHTAEDEAVGNSAKVVLDLERRLSGGLRHPRAVELGKLSPGRLLAPIRLRVRAAVRAEQAPKIGLPKQIDLRIAAANERDRVDDGAEQIGAPRPPAPPDGRCGPPHPHAARTPSPP